MQSGSNAHSIRFVSVHMNPLENEYALVWRQQCQIVVPVAGISVIQIDCRNAWRNQLIINIQPRTFARIHAILTAVDTLYTCFSPSNCLEGAILNVLVVSKNARAGLYASLCN